MFHGTSDLVVPYDYGLPFTVNIALPIVYGSNQIHNKLNSLNIENELYLEEGEPHEYWGTLNANWFGGPNEFYSQISNDAFNFLYSQLDNCILGDVNNDSSLDILDIVIIINMVLNNEYQIIADVNEDGLLNILDVVLIVSILVDETH